MVEWYAITKTLHVILAATWFGAVIYDALIALPRHARQGGLAGLTSFHQQIQGTIPFWAIAGFGALLSGYETARQAFDSPNPMAWPDVGASGTYILAGLALGVLSIVLGILQVPPSVARAVEARDNTRATALMTRIVWLGSIEAAVLTAVVVLMVGSNVGGF